jgi:uncharacterized protein (TIGR02145 family)
MNDIISTPKKEAWSFLKYFILIFLFILSFHPFLKVSAQEEEEVLVKPNPEPKYILGPQLLPMSYHQDTISGDLSPLILETSCPNSNFSTGTWDNWIGCYGTFSMQGFPQRPVLSPCITQGFATNQRRHVIETAPGYQDPYSCDSINTVFPGETFSARLGDTAGGGHAEQLKYNVTISQDNYLFIYRYAVVLESPNHSTSEQPGFTIQVQDTTNGILIDSCGYFSFTAPTCNNPPNCPNVAGWKYCPNVGYGNPPSGCYWKNWTTVGMNLTAYANLGTVRIVFTTRGCSHQVHRGYAYISAYCSAISIQTSLCEGQDSAILTAPPGFQHYAWSNGDTTQSITVPSVEGATIQCTLTAVNGCSVTILNTLHYTQIHTGFTATLNCAQRPSSFFDTTWVSQNQVTAWRWFFGDPASGSSDSSNLKNPTHSFTAPGNYNVTLISYSTDGCSDTIVKPVIVDTLVTINNSVTRSQICSNQHANIILTTNVNNALFTWTATASSGTITGFSDNAVPAPSPIDQILVNNGTQNDSVTYIITPHKGSCTGDPFTFRVLVFPTPTATITGTTAVCQNSASPLITFTGASGTAPYTFTYNINGAPDQIVTTIVGNSITVAAPTNAVGTFTYNLVSVHDGTSNTCSQVLSGSAVVTVNPLPTATITGTVEVCQNSASPLITFTGASATAPYTFTYNINGLPNQSVTTAIGNSVTVAAPTNVVGTFTYNLVSVQDGSSTTCSQAQAGSAVVTVTPLPTATITGTTAVCQNSASPLITFTGASSTAPYIFTYNINGAPDQTVTTIAGNSITVAASTNVVGTFTYNLVSVQDGSATTCSQAQAGSAVVTVNPLPVPAIAGSASVCLNSTTVYQANQAGMSNYVWTVSSGGTITIGQGTNIISVNWTLNGAQTVTLNYTDANGCTAASPKVFDVVVSDLPTPTLNGDTILCVGSTITYSTDLGNSAYVWAVSAGGTVTAGGGPADPSVTVHWTVTGAQTVSVNYQAGPGCSSPSPTVKGVTVNPLPTATIAGTIAVCQNSTSPLITFIGASATAPYTFTYNINGLPDQTVTTTVGNSVTVVAPTNAVGTFTYNLVSVQDGSSSACSQAQTGSAVVTVNSLPVPSITGPGSVCLNSTATYSTEANMTNYIWTVSAGGSITSGPGTNSVNILWSTTGTKTITVNYNDANGCTAATPFSYTVTVNILPVPALDGLSVICAGNSTIYTTNAGMNNYSWTVSAGGTITGGLGTSSITVLWNTAGPQTVSVNYVMGTGCTAANPTVLNVNVKPRPSVTNAANSTICSNVMTNIPLLASLPSTTFTWTATPSSGNVGGQSNSGGPVISQTLINSGFNIETVDYAVTPSLNGCDGAVAHYIVTVDPVADAYFNPNGQTICSGTAPSISILSHVAGAVFTWNGVGSSGNISGFGFGTTPTISQTLTSIGTGPETVTYTISPSFNSCPGTPNSVIVTVNPLPSVTYSICNDVITTTAAQPFKLKGGLPLGGTYTGTGVNTGIFYPSIAGIGNHTITYSYPNTWGCAANALQMISVINAAVFLCDNPMTDIRDNKQYPTVKIGTQCWMAANLNYGTVIVSSQMQRDNCIFEKYCFTDNLANCTSYGGLYQWDELMQYDNAAAEQGFCPPGWHVPTENEWTTLFNFYISNGFAGSPLKFTGYSGFNAFLSGTRFNNVNFYFSNFAVMFWSSTTHGADKAWAHGMNTFNPSVSYYPSSRTHAFNLRCIKD